MVTDNPFGKLNHFASQCKTLTRGAAKAGNHNKIGRPKVHAVVEEAGNISDCSGSYSDDTWEDKHAV